MLKKIIGSLLLIIPLYLAYYRGRKEGEAICVDFNVLPIVPNTVTFIVCLILLFVGVRLISKK